jgi:cobalt/nickel transport system permease protein
MHVHFLDPYHDKYSLMHHLDPRIKTVLMIFFILTCALIPVGAWPVYILLLALVVSTELLSELGVAFYLKRALLAIPFALAALPLLFTIPGAPLLSFSIGGSLVTLSQPGLERFISIALKSWISFQAALVLASTTRFPDLLAALRALRLPKLLVAIISLMWRYLFVIVNEALRLMRARAARSGKSSDPTHKTGGKVTWRAAVTGGMVGNLFLRSFDRSDRIYMAMLSRGYDGDVRSLPQAKISPTGWLVLLGGLTLLACLLALGFLVWG